jgi:ferredoxin
VDAVPVLVTVNPKKCGANGQCWQIAPNAFRLGPDVVAEVMAAEFSETELPLLRSAEEACPTGAITVVET